ncbi:MAG TPA: hypothetical protein VIP07_10090 [Candidatus Limnocylindria bacterium]|jgi:hypothetical protein
MTSITHTNTAVQTSDASTGPTAERKRARVAAVALIASPILWFVGAVAFYSTLGAFYNADDPVAKLNGIAGQRLAWTLQSLLFFAGAIAASVGLVILARLLRSDAPALARIGTIAASLSAIAAAAVLGIRFAAPLDGVRDASEVPPLLIAVHSFGASPSWLGTANILVAVAAVGLLAIALYTSGRARLTGALVTLGCVAVALTILARGGIPPVIVYPIAAILGVRLLFWRATGS